MFSLFHKDSSTLSEAKPGDQTPVGVEQSEAASFAGVGQAPSAVSVPPRLEANARAVVAPALAAETARRTGAAGADAAGLGSAGRHETAPGAVGRNSDNPQPPPRAACEGAPSPGPNMSWAGEEAAEFTEDDDEGSVDAEPVKEESETPVRLTGRRIGASSSKGRELKMPEQARRNGFTPEQRLLLLDTVDAEELRSRLQTLETENATPAGSRLALQLNVTEPRKRPSLTTPAHLDSPASLARIIQKRDFLPAIHPFTTKVTRWMPLAPVLRSGRGSG